MNMHKPPQFEFKLQCTIEEQPAQRDDAAELEITVGHRTFSVHIAHSSLCADIMSRHSLEQ